MTLEGAEKLNKGDRVLIEAIVESPHGRKCVLTNSGNIVVTMRRASGLFFADVHHETIKQKLAPPSREFRKGDIVIDKYDDLYICISDEKGGSVQLISNSIIYFVENCHKRYRLVCTASDRKDRKGAK